MTEQEAREAGAKIHQAGKTLPMTDEFHNASRQEQEWMIDGWLVYEEYHHSPISPHCEAVLAKPPSCEDFRGIRSWVLCKSWDIMEKEKRTKLPVGEAWREARKVCG